MIVHRFKPANAKAFKAHMSGTVRPDRWTPSSHPTLTTTATHYRLHIATTIRRLRLKTRHIIITTHLRVTAPPVHLHHRRHLLTLITLAHDHSR